MFEKEAKKYADNNFCGQEAQAIAKVAFKDGAELGYNKANEWHFVKDRDLPNTETKNYTYIRRRKRYKRQFTDCRVIELLGALFFV